MTNQLFAFDRASVRSVDVDGRLHVAITNISKAAVNPYLGREIPNASALGLDASKTYRLLRDPKELERGASTFDNIPLLIKHVAVSADDPHHTIVVGSTGTDATFAAPYLQNSLVVWDARAIERVLDRTQCQLSSAYRYDADMTPGEFEGQPYEGVMRNIRGNHVALVEVGRAGADVIVGDEMTIAKDAVLSSSTRNDLDADQFAIPSKRKLPIENADHVREAWDLLDDTDGLTAAEKTEARVRIRAAAKRFDVSTSGWNGASDAQHVTKGSIMPATKTAKLEAVLAKLKPYLAQDADMEKVKESLAADETEEERKKREAEEKTAKDEAEAKAKEDEAKAGREENKKRDDDKKAMDAAISAAVATAQSETVARLNGIREAERAVRPYVGDVFGMDSADAIYSHALKSLGVDTAGVPAGAFPAMLKLAGQRHTPAPQVAMDSAGAQTFSERFPNAARVKNI